MKYAQLTRFLLPLAVTIVVQGVGLQFLSGGMARVPQATATLASFGLAWGLVSLLVSALLQVKQLSLVLVEGRLAFNKVLTFIWLMGLLSGGLIVSFALGPFSLWLIEGLHGIEPALSALVRNILLWFIPLPLLRALALFYSGLLIQIRRTDIASYATLSGLGVSILAVFLLLPAEFVQNKPILLPIVVTYVGMFVELGVVVWGHRRYVDPILLNKNEGADLSLAYIIRFFWPLAFIMIMQGVSRPLINLFVSRGADGAEALAILTVVYALGHLPYGWLNEIRNLAPSFKNEPNSLPYIRRFALACGLVSFGSALLLFWTPLRDYILQTLIGLDPNLAARSAVPLMIFSFFSIVVTLRAHWHGVGLLEHRTKALAPSAPSRVGAILIALILLQPFDLSGATRGVAALLAGFTFESLAVWWGVQGRRIYLRRKENRKLAKVTN